MPFFGVRFVKLSRSPHDGRGHENCAVYELRRDAPFLSFFGSFAKTEFFAIDQFSR